MLASLSPEQVTATELAGEPITAKLTEAPGNGATIGGLKVTTESAWFAARPSGTEDVYKIYAESFRGAEHLAQVQAAAREVVSAALGRVGRVRAAADHDRAPGGRDLRRPAAGRGRVRAARLRRVLPVRPLPADRRRRPRARSHRRLGGARRAGPRHLPIRLGTMVSSATFRLPGPLAITVATVDAMSGGRVELGLGSGWFEAEHTSYGIPFPPVGERFDLLEEQLAIVTGLWATPAGETFSFSRRALHAGGQPRAAQAGAVARCR